MSRGGKRGNAGRKLGARTKRTQEIAAAAVKEGISPLEYMLGLMRDETQSKEVRMDMAKASAPYIHPKLANVDASVRGDMGLTVIIKRYDEDYSAE